MPANEFPEATFSFKEGLLIPTKDTVSRAARALAADDTPQKIRQDASDILNLHQDILETHPDWAADFEDE